MVDVDGSCTAGMEGFHPHGFAPLQFTGATVAGQPLAAADPTQVVLDDRDADPVAAPSDIGNGGESFTLDYLEGSRHPMDPPGAGQPRARTTTGISRSVFFW